MANINLSGSISATGVSILGSASVVFLTDANHTLSVAEYTNNFLSVTSSVSLTTTRSLIAPLVSGQGFVVQNNTSGGQPITVIGATGTGVTIANGSAAAVICDGTNYSSVSGSASGGAGGDLSGSYPNPSVIKINGTSVPATPSANQVLVATSGTASTWQQIVDAQVSASAAVAVSKLAAGTSAQLLLNNSTPTPTWTTITGDITFTSAGATNVASLQGNALLLPSPMNSAQDGYVLTWHNASSQWQALASSGFTAGGDLIGTSTSQQVSQITGDGHSGGTGVVLWENATTAPTSNPTGGSIVYENSGTLTQRGSGGVTYDIAPAGSGTVNSQAGIMNRKFAYARTTATTAVTVLTYTIPFSITFGACVMMEVLWSARDTTAANTMTAGFGKTITGFSVNSSGTVAQFPTTIGGSNMVTSMFIYTTSLVARAWDEITFDNVTANRFATTTNATPISFTTAASGVVNVLVNPNTTSAVNLDWTVDIYIQVT